MGSEWYTPNRRAEMTATTSTTSKSYTAQKDFNGKSYTIQQNFNGLYFIRNEQTGEPVRSVRFKDTRFFTSRSSARKAISRELSGNFS